LRLALEPAPGLFVGRLLAGKELDGDLAEQSLIFRSVYFAHPARAEVAQDAVMRDPQPFHVLGMISQPLAGVMQ